MLLVLKGENQKPYQELYDDNKQKLSFGVEPIDNFTTYNISKKYNVCELDVIRLAKDNDIKMDYTNHRIIHIHNDNMYKLDKLIIDNGLQGKETNISQEEKDETIIEWFEKVEYTQEEEEVEQLGNTDNDIEVELREQIEQLKRQLEVKDKQIELLINKL